MLKALGSPADAVILDLEDSVPSSAKEQARAAVCEVVSSAPATSQEVWVRINHGEAGEQDAREVAVAGALTGLCVPKVDDPAALERLDSLLTELECEFALEPMIESGRALFAVVGIAAAPRVTRIQLGEVDLAAELGVTPGPAGIELLWARSRVVAASAAAGINSPIAPVTRDFRDLEAFRSSTAALRALGFWGRVCIHPAQVEVANDVFTVNEHEVAWAREVLDGLDAAASDGNGVLLDGDGKLVDEAVGRHARMLLERAQIT